MQIFLRLESCMKAYGLGLSVEVSQTLTNTVLGCGRVGSYTVFSQFAISHPLVSSPHYTASTNLRFDSLGSRLWIAVVAIFWKQ